MTDETIDTNNPDSLYNYAYGMSLVDQIKDSLVTAHRSLEEFNELNLGLRELGLTPRLLPSRVMSLINLVDKMGAALSALDPRKESQREAQEKANVKAVDAVEEIEELTKELIKHPPHLLSLNADQAAALAAIQDWVKVPDQPFFVVRGPAGTGKSTLMAHVKHAFPAMIPTALTNKACRVLSRMLGEGAPCKTIYSALGLVMAEEEGELVLTKSDRPTPINVGSLYMVDEASMTNKEVMREIRLAADVYDLKFLFVGDAFQLPPVGENTSPVWRLDAPKAILRQIMRFDSSLLQLSIALRERIGDKTDKKYANLETLFIPSDEIVVSSRFKMDMVKAIVQSKSEGRDIRGIAWTNRQVDEYNQAVRQGLGFEGRFEIGDSLMLAAPIEQFGAIIATIDDEVTVRGVNYGDHTVNLMNSSITLEAWKLEVSGDWQGTLLIPASEEEFQSHLTRLADKARYSKGRDGIERKVLWADFWSFKRSLHSVRYSYCTTVHRVQGSTVDEAYVDVPNILRNKNQREMMKCLYVACSRSRSKLVLRST